jgi:hypothetical protein
MFDPPSQTDMTFVEDRSPLHGRAVQRLAGPAVADLGIQRIGAYLVADRTAVTACPVTRGEGIVVNAGVFGAEVAHSSLLLPPRRQAVAVLKTL